MAGNSTIAPWVG